MNESRGAFYASPFEFTEKIAPRVQTLLQSRFTVTRALHMSRLRQQTWGPEFGPLFPTRPEEGLEQGI